MSGALQQLLRISSGPIAEGTPAIEFLESTRSSALDSELAALLSERNGFFAFESALRVFPAQTVPESYGLADWNAADLWKMSYGGSADLALCFAEDIFGNQFALRHNRIVLFNVETGELDEFSASIEEWAASLLGDYDFTVGHTFARDWQKSNGVLPGRHRLCPITPFVAGGEYVLENLSEMDGAKLMQTLGEFAQVIRGQADGSRLQLKKA
jgi:hypothetical protein